MREEFSDGKFESKVIGALIRSSFIEKSY